MNREDILASLDLNLPKDFQLSEEGFTTSLFEFVTGMASEIRRVGRKVFNTAVTIEADVPYSPNDLEKIIKFYGWSNMKPKRCFAPSKMRGSIPEHLEVLEEQIEMIVDIEKRLLDPTILFLKECIANKEALEGVWADKDLKMLDTDKMKSDLGKTFEADKIDKDRPLYMSVGEAYSNSRQMTDTSKKLKDMLENAQRLDIGYVVEKEKELAELIDELVEEARDVNVNRQIVSKLANAVSSAVVEMEMMSALFYYLNVNIGSYNITAENLERQYEIDRKNK